MTKFISIGNTFPFTLWIWLLLYVYITIWYYEFHSGYLNYTENIPYNVGRPVVLLEILDIFKLNIIVAVHSSMILDDFSFIATGHLKILWCF